MHNTPSGRTFLKWYPILVHARRREKQKEKTLIPGPVWSVEKFDGTTLLQTSTSYNEKCSMKFTNTSQFFSKCYTKIWKKL